MKSTKFLFLATKKALAAKLGLFVDRDLVAFEGLKPLVSILESPFYGAIDSALTRPDYISSSLLKKGLPHYKNNPFHIQSPVLG